MGICISSASSEIHQEDGLENLMYLEEKYESNGNHEKSGFLYTKAGSKGLNQDAAILHQGYGTELGSFCGVFDGHGKNGHVVSKLVRNRLATLVLEHKNAFENTKQVGETDDERLTGRIEHAASNDFRLWKEACVGAFKVMDKEIKIQENLDCSCSGTTAVVVIRQDVDLVIANLGDSRALLVTIDDNGLLPVQLTTDLKPSLKGEADRIKKCNGRVFALRTEPHIQRVWLPNEDSPGLAMSRAFGDFLLKDHGIIALPHVTYRRITPNDQFIVLASDGVWDVLSNEEVALIVWGAGSETAAAKAVVDSATATWRKRYPTSRIDDCTAVCLFLQKKQQERPSQQDSMF